MSSKLYVVSTPIGNLEDITLRALEVLRGVDTIACEDTRTTKKLLARYQITKPLTSYHEHNEAEKARDLIKKIQSGACVAIVTDAGTPGVSDPGYRIVKLASEEGVNIVPVPGPSAAIAALSVSGLPTSGFAFFGFPPRSGKQLREFLKRVKNYPETLIFYESPKRVIKTLDAVSEILGNRNISLSREITKIYEETLRGSTTEVIDLLNERESIKGEITIVVEGVSGDSDRLDPEQVDKLLLALKNSGISLKDAVKEMSAESGMSKSNVYKRALEIWDK